MFSAHVYTFEEGTEYYFQACATIDGTTICSEIFRFTDICGVQPNRGVVTNPVECKRTRATLNGAVTLMEPDYLSADVFFKYGTDPTLIINTPVSAETLSSHGMFVKFTSVLSNRTGRRRKREFFGK
jgi:hypothetical protein